MLSEDILAREILFGFKDLFESFKREGIITEKALDKFSDFNIHSILQYCLISAARERGIIALPEYRLRLSRPIKKQEISHKDPKQQSMKQRNMRTIRADIGFLYSNGKLIGIGEIYTPDGIHGCKKPSGESEGQLWITPYRKLTHIAEHEDSVKLILLVIGAWKLPGWKEAREKSLDEWVKCWRNLVDKLSERKVVGAVIIQGLDSIETYQSPKQTI